MKAEKWTITYLDKTPSLEVEAESFVKAVEKVKDKLSYASLKGVDLSYANLALADLHHADLRGACLEYVDLSYANLAMADLSFADLSGADLSGTSFKGTDLHGAVLKGAVLSGTDLSGACLEDVNLTGADLGDAYESKKTRRWKMTNGDKIRQMGDEGLLKRLANALNLLEAIHNELDFVFEQNPE